jgi:hypothetical protein
MLEGGALTWRDVVQKYHSGLIDDLSAHLDSELKEAKSRGLAEGLARARSEIESLNQVLRRLRAAGADQVLQLLGEACAPYAEKLVVLVFDSHQTWVAAGAGVSAQEISFETSLAPAVVTAIESRDPVIALATAGEISAPLSEAFGTGLKAYLFPIVSRHTVVAMVVAAENASAPVRSAQFELLCEAAGLRLEAAPQIPKLEKNESQPARASASAWETLTADDQKLHMQAQRMARLRTAEMRLEHSGELQSGATSRDIYAALRQPIDKARNEFREAFLVKSPTMVDYLHLEILRSLAADDEPLLGKGYPGPMQASSVQAEPTHV